MVFFGIFDFKISVDYDNKYKNYRCGYLKKIYELLKILVFMNYNLMEHMKGNTIVFFISSMK